MIRVSAFLLCIILLSGCSGDKVTVWQRYQEPVEPLPYPEDTGVQELNEIWDVNIPGGGDNGYSLLLPALYGDYIITASNNGEITAFERQKGKKVWAFDADATLYAGVGVSEQYVAYALEDGSLGLLLAEDGTLVWQVPTQRIITTVPQIGRGRIVVKSAKGSLLAFALEDGRLLWEQDLPTAQLGIRGYSTPLVVNNSILTGLSQGLFVSMNLQTGEDFWAQLLAAPDGATEVDQLVDSDAPPILFRDWVIASTERSGLSAMRLQTGQILWQNNAIATRLPMVLYDEFLVVTDALGRVHLVDAVNGAILWTQGVFAGRGMSHPVVIGNRVIIGDLSGRVHALNLVNGELVQTLKIFSEPVRNLVVADGRIFIITADGDLSAVELMQQPQTIVETE